MKKARLLLRVLGGKLDVSAVTLTWPSKVDTGPRGRLGILGRGATVG